MPTLQELRVICQEGRFNEAHELALADLDAAPDNIWEQRKVGWILYYMLSNDVNKGDYEAFSLHLMGFQELNELKGDTETILFESVFWRMGAVLKNTVPEDTSRADLFFDFLKNYTFNASKGYSYLLQSYLKFEQWHRLIEFFEWWNLSKFTEEDVKNQRMSDGRTTMSLAERVYIAYSKALLRQQHADSIAAFIPQIEAFIEIHPEMPYLGYYCGKLMMATGANTEDTLENLLPFVRKKQGEFWVWQLLADLYKEDVDLQLACLTRAIHCRTQESFLGKTHLRLANLYVQRGDYARAKYHIETYYATYTRNGWNISFEVQNLLRAQWMQRVTADSSDAIDYAELTNRILFRGAQCSIAVVTHVDRTRQRIHLVYGERQRTTIRFSDVRQRTDVGTFLLLYWLPRQEEGVNMVGVIPVKNPDLNNLAYLKRIEGRVRLPEGQQFTFLRQNGIHCYVGKHLLQGITDGQTIKVLAVLDYNSRKSEWSWSAVRIER